MDITQTCSYINCQCDTTCSNIVVVMMMKMMINFDWPFQRVLYMWLNFYWHRLIFQVMIRSHAHGYTYTCLLLLISMLWHKQAIFESKGDKLSSSAEFRIRTQGLWNRISNRLNARWQTDWAIRIHMHAHTHTRTCLIHTCKHANMHTYITYMFVWCSMAHGNAYNP